MIFISTDYVFDGKSPPYTVDSQPNPLNKYGMSKLAGEKVVQEASKGCIINISSFMVMNYFDIYLILLRIENIIFRVPILYGPVEYVEESAVTILFKNVSPEKCTSSFIIVISRASAPYRS